MNLMSSNCCWPPGPPPSRAALQAGPLEEEVLRPLVEQCAVPASTRADVAGRQRCAESRPERQAGTPCSPPWARMPPRTQRAPCRAACWLPPPG
eukprot:10327177-Alexandrium_andersonii.AAC.1